MKLHEMANHQGNRELSTTLQCCFSISEALKRYYCCRNNRKAEREKENNIFKSQLEGVNQTLVRHFSCVCLYLPKIYCILFVAESEWLQIKFMKTLKSMSTIISTLPHCCSADIERLFPLKLSSLAKCQNAKLKSFWA